MKYFIVEQSSPNQRNIYVPSIITGYGKYEWEEFWKDQENVEYSPFMDVVVKTLLTNKDYNQYIKMMQEQGVRINFNGRKLWKELQL